MSARFTRPVRRLLVAAAVGVPLSLAAIASAPARSTSAAQHEPVGDPVPAPLVPGPRRVGLTTVTTAVTAPLAGVTAPGHPGELFVVDQVGTLWSLDISNPAAWPVRPRAVLNVADLLVGPTTPTDERGLLGAAFSPTFATDGLIYTDTSEAFDAAHPADFRLRRSTDPCLAGHPQTPDHIDVVREWRVTNPASPTMTVDRSAPGQGRRLFAAEHPQANHNAGDLHFGPDGWLYITDGDGGGADDQDCQTNFDGNPMFGHPAPGNGQSVNTPLGKVLRIDPHPGNSANGQYGIPPDNPFATNGPPGALREIFAFGLRNPFRFSFDAVKQDLWIADVGQNDLEEVDHGINGANYGWHVKEGTFLFDPGGFQLKGARSDGFPFQNSPATPGELTDPVAQYDHDEGTAIIGGYVYRGTTMPALRGFYVFGDTSRRLDNRHGRLFTFDADNRSATAAGNTITELRDGPLDAQLIGFGQDSNNELYAMVFGSRATGDTGAVLRLSQATPPVG
jgi:glucose/sorbosone dehydrogenase